MEITLMKRSDAHEMAELDKKCFAVPWSEKSFHDEAENLLAVYFVARIDKQIIGYAGFWNVAGEGDITNVAVLPEFRKQGVGSRLIEAVIKRAAELGLSILTLEVRRSNISAQMLYSKYGFEVIGERKRYYSDNREDALIMIKRLENG